MATPLTTFKVGNIYESRNFGSMEVIANTGSRNVTVKFLNTGTIVGNLQRSNVIRGTVKDVFVPSVEGVGYLGTYDKVTKSVAYSYWHSMLERCYNSKYHKNRPTYVDCTVDNKWHNFTSFKKWFDINYVEGYHLDKDLLVQDNKVYSEETCCFIPPSLNSILVEKSIITDGCEIGVTKRRKKGSKEYNGLYNVCMGGVYLARTENLEEANALYKEYKKLLFEEISEKYELLGMITPYQAFCLKERVIK